MAESFSREKLRHAPQKEGGWGILCDLPPVWPRLVRPTNLMSRMNRKKKNTHTHRIFKTAKHFGSEWCTGTWYPAVLSTCYDHSIPILGVGKERRILIGPWWPAKAALVRNCLEVCWPRAGGLSAVNAIGTQLRDPINSGLTRRRMAIT